jgi:hypothetical protein
MSVFRIISASSAKGSNVTVFRVRADGSAPPAMGEKFTCWDTHHPAEYMILDVVTCGENLCVLDCEGRLGFENQFSGALVDTNHRGTPAGFRYGMKNDA